MPSKHRQTNNYWLSTLLQRTTAAKGSRYLETTPEQLEASIMEASWQQMQITDPATGCTYFRADLPGLLGMTAISELPLHTPIDLIDPKGTGEWSACVTGTSKLEVDYSVLILGIDEGKEIVFTVHPGYPVPFKPVTELPAYIAERFDAGRIRVSRNEALFMGFIFAKFE